MTVYLLAVHHSGTGPELSDEQMQASYQATDAFNQELQESGSWVFAGGLHPADTATVVDGRGPEPLVTDGPYVDTKEQLGGFWIVEAADLDEALELARRGSAACLLPVEVRPFMA
ncbi:MAG: YciI family protein, partial [Acidimicrobiales bacterium]